ncbi:MAG: hypothetical protein ACE5GV_14955 [Candidatus Scalindua sp.]
MLTVSTRTLNVLAALVWYVGGIVLLIRGSTLLVEAHTLRPETYWICIVIAAGLCLGGFKGVFIFSKSCQKNIARVGAIKQPKVWQFFKPRFFVVLAVMIMFGATLSRLALTYNSYLFLIGVSIVDIDIGIALLWSSNIFWKQKAFVK